MSEINWETKVVSINRCAKVVKGGRRFSFSVLVVGGDKNGSVGYGIGKAKEMADAIRKGEQNSKKHIYKISLLNHTIPHEVCAKFDGGRVVLKPAAPGAGIIAGGSVRPVLELLGVRNVLSKSLGSNNKINVVRATLEALSRMRTKAEMQALKAAEPDEMETEVCR